MTRKNQPALFSVLSLLTPCFKKYGRSVAQADLFISGTSYFQQVKQSCPQYSDLLW